PLSQLYNELVTLMWSAKEAIFKWYGLGGVDFRQHIILQHPVIIRPNEWVVLDFLFKKGKPVLLPVRAKIFDHLVLAFVNVNNQLDI
ncbi:MAG TPA: hypothetical protein VM012_08720, partial [Flavitalea sp.]|nr:hypothetical protein [Flavitalea sp.]